MTDWAATRFTGTAERASGLRDNLFFTDVTESAIEALIGDDVQEGCDAVAIVCADLRGACLAAALEAEMGVPILDSVAVTL